MEALLENREYLPGPYSFADIAFYMAQLFGDRMRADIPLIGSQRVKDLVEADINKVLKDMMAGKVRASVKTKKLRGRAIVRGGGGAATRTVGLGGILTCGGGWHHRDQPGARDPQAERQCADAPLV
jgi:hypothetical protein